MRSCGCSCGGEDRSVSKRDGSTVFKGAVIGQVFTGHVEIRCPLAHHDAEAAAPAVNAEHSPSTPVATALLAIAIWQAWMSLPTGSLDPSEHAAHAGFFLIAGVAAKYATGARLRTVMRRALGWLRRID